MDVSHTIKSVKEGHITWIRTDGVILKRKEKKMIHREIIFLALSELINNGYAADNHYKQHE